MEPSILLMYKKLVDLGLDPHCALPESSNIELKRSGGAPLGPHQIPGSENGGPRGRRWPGRAVRIDERSQA